MSISTGIETKYAAPGFTNSIETSEGVCGSVMRSPVPQPLRNLYHAMAVWSEKLIPNSLHSGAGNIKAALSHNDFQLGNNGLHPVI